MSNAVRVAVSAAILGWLAWKLDWGQLAGMARTAHPGWLATAVGVYMFTQVLSALRWRAMARPLGFDGSVGRFVGVYYVGMYFNLLLPSSVGGDVVRVLALDRGTGRRTAALVTVMADRASGLTVLVALACAATLVCPVPLAPAVVASAWGVAGVLVLALAAGPAVAVWLHRTQPPLDWLPASARLRVRNLARLSAEAVAAYGRRPGLVAASAALSLVVQAANVGVVALIALALGLNIPFAFLAVTVPLVTLLTLVPVSLNGMGVREAGMGLLLAGQATPTAAVGLAFLWFVVTAASSLAGLVVYLLDRPARPAAGLAADDRPHRRAA